MNVTMSKRASLKRLLWILVLPVIFIACEDKMDEHYKVPDWLKGNAWEVLESRGNYTTFLKGVDIAGFRPMMEGKNILTVMAPNDEAFSEYLKNRQVSAIDELPLTEVRQLIGFHMLYYSYNKQRLINYRPEGDDITEEQAKVNAGLYYKFRSKSQDTVSYVDTPDDANPGQTKRVAVYHPERLLPIFSNMMFTTKQIDPDYNYRYFFPNSEWTGASGFNVSEASVTEYEVVTDNGYIYCIDRVLEPLETIYTELAERPNYSLFLKAYNRFMTQPLQKDNNLTNDYGNGEDLYQITHTGLPSIACEWNNTDFKQIDANARNACNVFAPTNEALTSFFQNYWQAGGYESLDDVYKVALLYLLKEYSHSGSIIFPQEIKEGKYNSDVDGKPFQFDVDQVKDRLMCSNGILYGLSDMTIPAVFKSVIGSAFQRKNYSVFLFMLDKTKMVKSLSSTDSRFAVLIPSDSQLESAGIAFSPESPDQLNIVTASGEAAMTTSQMSDYISINVAMSDKDLKDNKTYVLKTNASFNYWYVKGGKVISSNEFNNINGNNTFRELTELKYNQTEEWSNGKVYTYSGTLFQPTANRTLMRTLTVNPEASSITYQFTQLLNKAGLIASETLGFIEETSFLAFAPSNQAILDAQQAGKIPGVNAAGKVTDKAKLANWLKYYFIRIEDSGLTDYPYVGSGMDMECVSYAMSASEDYLPVMVKDNGQKITIGNNAGETAAVTDDFDQFPLVFSDGCLHVIDGVIEYKNN